MQNELGTSMRIAATAAPLRQQVAEKIREAIAEGTFASGSRLVERELCELLGVSRTSLREALRELETEGLISNVPNKGLVVTSVSVESAREIYEVREMFEGLLAERFAVCASDDEIAQLEIAVKGLENAYVTSSGVMGAKNQFYKVLMQGAKHSLASTMLKTIQVRAGQLRRTTLSHPDRAVASITEIRGVLAQIKARNPDGARIAAIKHVRNAATLAIELLAAVTPPPT